MHTLSRWARCARTALFAVYLSSLVTPTAWATEPAPFKLYPGAAPGSAAAHQKEVIETRNGGHIVRNVTVPTLEAFLPSPLKSTGAAVIIAPGGAFMMLSYDTEGTLVAKWLADHGIPAFVLKYRLEETPADSTAFLNQLRARMDRDASTGGAPHKKSAAEDQAAADATEAVRLVRRRAREFNVEPNNIGLLGFSAGGITAARVATAADATGRPDFVGIIYGALNKTRPLTDTPPAFMATASDDPLLGKAAYPMYAAWMAAGRSAELHLYERGGHGFGLVGQGSSSDHWMDEFYWWLQSRRIIKTKP